MPYTQANRDVDIATPLGDDTLLLKSCVISEQLGRPFVMKAELLAEDEDKVKALKLIGKGVSLRWKLPGSGGDEMRPFSGYVSAFVERPQVGNFFCYEATIVPWLWFLTRTSDCRIFHDKMDDPPKAMTVPGIIQKVFKDHGFDDVTPALNASYRTLDHCVQYQETDFDFVSRLMETEGIYYFFEHEDDGGTIKHKLKLVDAMSTHEESPGYEALKYRPFSNVGEEAEKKGSILSWLRKKQVAPGNYKINDFDFKRPKVPLLGSDSHQRSHANASFEVYDNAASYADEDEGEYGNDYAKLRLEELQSKHDIVSGVTDCRGLACGAKFKLEGHPRGDENGEYLVISATYRCSVGAGGDEGQDSDGASQFSCEFRAIPTSDGNVFRPTRITRLPRIQGPQTAIVVGKAGDEIFTDKFGRIKIQFHWDRYSKANQDSPCWARVSQLWAGNKWGGMFLPRIGQEVIVEFLDGNPDRPIVTGCVYNGIAEPPYPLTVEDNLTISTIKSNSSKGGQGFNEIRFQDKKGNEQVFTHAEKDQDIRVKNDTKEWIGNDRHLIVKANQYELVEKDKHAHVKGDHLEKIDGDAGSTVKGNTLAKVEGNDHLTVDGNYVQKIGGNLHEAVTGNHHEKTTGDILLSATGHAHVKSSQNAAVEAAMNAHVKGGMVVVIEAGMQLSLKAGSNFIDIGPAGISIQGTMVNINMGGAAGAGSGAQAAAPSSPSAPDPTTDPLEAATADPGQSNEAMDKPTPPEPKKFSPSAIALQEAAAAGAPMVESSPDTA